MKTNIFFVEWIFHEQEILPKSNFINEWPLLVFWSLIPVGLFVWRNLASKDSKVNLVWIPIIFIFGWIGFIIALYVVRKKFHERPIRK